MPDQPDPLDPYMNRILSMIDRFGWAAQAVGASEDMPSFTYTVGLTGQGKPELIIYGIPYEQAHAILAQLVDRELHHGDILTDVLEEGFVLRVIEGGTVDMGVAKRLYGDEKVQGLQIVWPDNESHFPWDDGFDLHRFQPLRGAPPDDPAD